jgi:hypothetical protein
MMISFLVVDARFAGTPVERASPRLGASLRRARGLRLDRDQARPFGAGNIIG